MIKSIFELKLELIFSFFFPVSVPGWKIVRKYTSSLTLYHVTNNRYDHYNLARCPDCKAILILIALSIHLQSSCLVELEERKSTVFGQSNTTPSSSIIEFLGGCPFSGTVLLNLQIHHEVSYLTSYYLAVYYLARKL